MYLTGMGTKIATFFQTTTMIISIPSVIILTCLFISLWGGSIRFNTPMLFALAFLPMFGIGGLTGLPLGFNVSDLHLHDTYYVIAHFHYVVAPGTIFALFAGIYYWFPKMTGRMMNEFWGKVHFWRLAHFHERASSSRCSRRAWRACCAACTTAAPTTPRRNVPGAIGGLSTSDHELHTLHLSGPRSGLGLVADSVHHQFLLEHQARQEGRRRDNPWDATTLEWQTPTPPPHGNFAKPPEVYRGPYEYSVPGHDDGFHPAERTGAIREALTIDSWKFPTQSKPRPDTGLYNAKVGIWLFLASEVMLFGALVLGLHPAARRRAGRQLAARLAQHPDRHVQHRWC